LAVSKQAFDQGTGAVPLALALVLSPGKRAGAGCRKIVRAGCRAMALVIALGDSTGNSVGKLCGLDTGKLYGLGTGNDTGNVGGRIILPKWHAYASNSFWQSYASIF